MGDLWTFLIIVAIAYSAFALVGLVVAPMLSLPRAALRRYELRKVRLATMRIDAKVREKAVGALSHPTEEDQGNVSLVSRS